MCLEKMVFSYMEIKCVWLKGFFVYNWFIFVDLFVNSKWFFGRMGEEFYDNLK